MTSHHARCVDVPEIRKERRSLLPAHLRCRISDVAEPPRHYFCEERNRACSKRLRRATDPSQTCRVAAKLIQRWCSAIPPKTRAFAPRADASKPFVFARIRTPIRRVFGPAGVGEWTEG